jgi:hypothetical protein
MTNGFVRNDQPFKTYLYNTDQFTDPKFGFTIHDDGSPTYTEPTTGIIYTKERFYNAQAGGYASYNIVLVLGVQTPPADSYVAADGVTNYVDESGLNFYIPVAGAALASFYIDESGLSTYVDETGTELVITD